ncbi:MAG: ABC transporter permease [Pyrinomonadaceae bacterium]
MQNTQTIKIKPGSWLASLDLRELWHYRELFYLLVWRDLKVRYKQTILGVFWAVLQPALTALIFTIVFSRVARFETGDVPYWLFVLSGFTFWTFVSSSVTLSANAFVYHTQLVTKVYFPRMILPASSVGAYFIDLLLTLVILFGAMIYAGTAITWEIIFVPLFLIYLLSLTISASLLLSALNVRFRDVKFIIPFFLQVWLFISPVFYSSDWVPEKWRYVFALNPVTGCLDGFRHVLFGTNLDYISFIISISVTIILFFTAILVFRRMEDDFADLL